MRIGYATTDWAPSARGPDDKPTLGGAGWYRVGLPARALGEHSEHETCLGTLSGLSDGSLGIREFAPGEPRVDDHQLTGTLHTDCDMIVMQRYMGHEVADWVAKARAQGQVIVNDVDDWFFGLDQRNQAWKATHPKHNPDQNIRHYRDVLAASSAVTVSTEFLRARFADMLRVPVLLVRNAIDLDRWTPNIPDPDLPLTLGWIGAQSWRSGDLDMLRGFVPAWCRNHRGRWYHGGHVRGQPFVAKQIGLDPNRVWCLARELAAITHYPDLFGPLDIGLVPLRAVAFNEAKSTIKGLEYAAAGVPFVASPSGEYERLARQGIGRIARKPKEWLRHLDQLADPETRALEAKAQRERVERHDIAACWPAWDRAYREIAEVSVH